jgi:hypothetical protein
MPLSIHQVTIEHIYNILRPLAHFHTRLAESERKTLTCGDLFRYIQCVTTQCVTAILHIDAIFQKCLYGFNIGVTNGYHQCRPAFFDCGIWIGSGIE